MNFYGFEHFYFEIIEECNAENLDERERYWIEKESSMVPYGYNILSGGRILYGENNPFYGKHHSEQTKRIISEKNTGRKQSQEEREMRSRINSGNNNPFYGKHHSEETKQKIIETSRQNGLYIKASERMKNNNPNDGSLFSKMTAMFDNNFNIVHIFKSATEAGSYIKDKALSKGKTPEVSISEVCRGTQKSAFGFYWRYVTPKRKMQRAIHGNQFIINRRDDLFEEKNRFCD